jgi:hypothetical protein
MQAPPPASANPTLHQSTSPGDHKTASITIRMSEAECAQLRQRAADAGLTISAYLRSCTFEAEALRGQVKEALAQIRAAVPAETKPPSSCVERHKKSGWLARIFPHGTVTSARAMN